MGESSVTLKGSIDPSKIKKMLDDMAETNIHLNMNTQEILDGLKSIKDDLKELQNGTYKIKLQVDGDVGNQLTKISKQIKDVRDNSNGNGNPLFSKFNADLSKQIKEAEKQAEAYKKALESQGAKNISTQIQTSYDKDGVANVKAIVNFEEAAGRATKAVLELNAATGEWEKHSTSVTTNYEKQARGLKTLFDNATNWQSKLDNASSVAFNQSKPLQGDYATPVQNEIDGIQRLITNYSKLSQAFEKSGNPIGEKAKAQFDSWEREITTGIERVNRLTKEQKFAEYPPTKLSSTEISESVKQYVNQIESIEQKMKSAGTLTDDFASKFQSIKDGFNNVGQDSTALRNWIDQFGTFRTEIDKFESSPEGIAQKMSAAIDTEGIQKVKDTLGELYELRETKDMKLPGIEDLTGQLHSLMDDYQALKDQMSGSEGPIDEESLKRLSAVYDELNQKAKDLFKEAGTYTNDDLFKKFTLDAENLQIRFDKLKQKYEDFLKAGGKRDTGLEDRFKAVQESIDNVKPGNISEVNKEMRNLGSTVGSVVTPAQSLSQVLRDNFGELGGFLARFASFTVIIQKSIQAIRSMVNEVRQLDTSLVELQKVTNLSGLSLDNFVDRAYKIGEGLGRTGKDVIDATTTFSRAGYDLQEATELAQAALVMTNVGVDIPNMEAAASDMISILRAYDKQANESMSVIDKLYNVANTQPLDFGNITDMLVTAGGTLAQTNTTLEETMALLTSGFATLRDTSVANG